ncbi:MAG: putative zinc-binding metallopeptidase [Planctomycetes bacterium]|nr:putative zinc-binding metallopeptidase [Planctomycetota bacterium]
MKRKTARKTTRKTSSARQRKVARPRRKTPTWARLSDDELLDVRLSKLGLRIEGTVLQKRVAQVQRELDRRGLLFKPHFWLSDEWFTPDGVPGAAIPFYLAHPRLMRLEKKQMLEVEGGTRRWCMQLLRHEVGHAISNAFRLHRKRKWQRVFGNSSKPYPDIYLPKPSSRKFVLHLDYWYAQSHPAEDFAETFAVWLTPGSQWRTRYEGWPALKKLEYVDELMREIAGTRPVNYSRRQVEPLKVLRTTLRDHYRRKRARYGKEFPDFYVRDLRRLFTKGREHADKETAATFLRRVAPQLRSLVAAWTGQYEYTIDQVLKEMITRSREMGLRVHRPKQQTTLEVAILLTIQTMNFLQRGNYRVAL